MAILPWDDWFFHLSREKQEIQNLYNEYTHKRDLIAIEGQTYNHNLSRYQALTVYNTALMVALQNSSFTDSEYGQWLEDNQTPPKTSADGSSVAEAFQYVTTTAGTWMIGCAIKRFASNVLKPAAKSAYQRIAASFGTKSVEATAEDVADQAVKSGISEAAEQGAESAADEIGEAAGRSATRAVIEALTLEQVGTLALAGGIFVAVGLDAILGAIDGAQEKSELDKQKSKLQDAMNTIDDYLSKLRSSADDLENHIKTAEQQFLDIIALLSNIQEPSGYNWNYPVNLENLGNFVMAAQSAAGQYTILAKIRNDWTTMSQNTSSLTWELFHTVESLQRPTTMTTEQFEAFLNFVADHSEEMKAARDAAETVHA